MSFLSATASVTFRSLTADVEVSAQHRHSGWYSSRSRPTAQRRPGPLYSLRFLHHTQGHTTFGRTPLDEGSAHRRDLYLTTHNTHKTQTFMLLAGLELSVPASERPQTLASDRSATAIGGWCSYLIKYTTNIYSYFNKMYNTYIFS